MKRFHVHVSVANLSDSIRFYSELFGNEPAVRKPDYAKWMLDDPRVNFAISTHGQRAGVNHLGFQVDSDEELRGMKAQLVAADAKLVQENEQPCCYARSDKYWVTDPTGIAWEAFHTLSSIPVYCEVTPEHGISVTPVSSAAVPAKTACCAPAAKAGSTPRQSQCGVPDESAA
jgi:catechol 2,3-dioxygenase-like lactoylglutathione lyase family enzyme